MDDLTKIEETVLLAILQLENRAYGYEIRKFILDRFKKELSYGNLYSCLYQMDKKGFVSKSIGKPTDQRRGKAKIYYAVTKSGLASLKTARDSHDLIWEAMPDHALDI